MIEADYYHREMRNLLGVRLSNLAFRSTCRRHRRSFDPPNPTGELRTFGPFFEGRYDGLVVSLNKRLSNRYLIGANYTYAKATDNSLGIFTTGTDQFIGIVPVVTEPCPASNPTCTRQTNANGSFISRNGNFVAAAGTFVNGPDLDKGPIQPGARPYLSDQRIGETCRGNSRSAESSGPRAAFTSAASTP